MDDRIALGRTPVGRRFIALMTIFNNADTERLHQYISDSYSQALLENTPIEEQLQQYSEIYGQTGKLRVHQIVATDEHRVVVIMQAQANNAFYIHEIAVENDYPHKIIEYNRRAME